MHKITAFLMRDARLALSYQFTFWMQFASVFTTVAGFYYMATLVHPSAKLGVNGKPLDYFTYVVVNLAFTLLMTAALQAFSQTLRRDQVAGTLEAIFVTPTSIWLIAVASGAWPLLLGILQTLTYFAVAFLFGLRFTNVDVVTLLLFLILGMTCMASLGILGGAVVVRYKQTPPSTFLVGSAAALLTGVLFPVSILPRGLQAVSWLLPMTHALNGFRAAMIGAAPSAVFNDLLWLAAASLLLAPFSLVVFARTYAATVREATLAYY
jgi:ABC-2 type transport system permease protein